MQRSSYGYLWFSRSMGNHPVFWAWGFGAQFAVVVPSLGLVNTTTATNPHPRAVSAQNNAVMGVVANIVTVAA